ncbi:hypothetical protein EVAR_30588_1 [Eumeta japonica]|uniref:Uncharacterized protein n=1 Tax=Eumeta variegata TaxID=151549 RepID=A0A4C1W9D9_EUMVA|nr:hypothetical protein EVAR_30588_1 [Eumeta japonica]
MDDVSELTKNRRLYILCVNKIQTKGSDGAIKRGSFDTYWSGVDQICSSSKPDRNDNAQSDRCIAFNYHHYLFYTSGMACDVANECWTIISTSPGRFRPRPPPISYASSWNCPLFQKHEHTAAPSTSIRFYGHVSCAEPPHFKGPTTRHLVVGGLKSSVFEKYPVRYVVTKHQAVYALCKENTNECAQIDSGGTKKIRDDKAKITSKGKMFTGPGKKKTKQLLQNSRLIALNHHRRFTIERVCLDGEDKRLRKAEANVYSMFCANTFGFGRLRSAGARPFAGRARP